MVQRLGEGRDLIDQIETRGAGWLTVDWYCSMLLSQQHV